MRELEQIKNGLAMAFAGMDNALQLIAEQAGPVEIDHNAGDPIFKLIVMPSDDPERPCIVEVHEVAPVARLVGFVELKRSGVLRMIDALASTVGRGVLLSLPKVTA